MNYKLTALLTILTLFLAACGITDRIEQEVSEQVVEQVASQLSGGDVDIEVGKGGDLSSISISDGEGGTINFATDANAPTDKFSAYGFTLSLPDGIAEAAMQTTQYNESESAVSGTYGLEKTIDQSFFDALTQEITNAGFTLAGRLGESDTSITNTMLSYQHTDGYMLTAMLGETDLVLSLIKADIEDSNSSGTVPLPTVLDGSMTLDKEKYVVDELIVVRLNINTPLPSDAWVGVIPSDTPHGLESDADAVDLSYAYVNGEEEVTLYAPFEPGTYDVRLFNTDDGAIGVELASVTITVE